MRKPSRPLVAVWTVSPESSMASRKTSSNSGSSSTKSTRAPSLGSCTANGKGTPLPASMRVILSACGLT